MKLEDLLKEEIKVNREVLIGREINVQDKKALILGLTEREEVEDGELETVARLVVLHEEAMDDEEDWEEEDWDEAADQTNRQVLIEAMDADSDISVVDIEAFYINGDCYETSDLNMCYLEEQLYEETMQIRHFADKQCIPSNWMQKETDMLVLAEYAVDPSIFGIDWSADILNITVEMMEPVEEVLVGKVVKCSCGHYDVPKEFSIKGKNGEDITVKLHGMYLHNIWADVACLETDFSELEEYCDRKHRLLVVEYSVDADLQMEFYTREYLDAPASENEEDYAASIGVIPANPDRELRVVDVVPEAFDEEVEIELLSYIVEVF